MNNNTDTDDMACEVDAWGIYEQRKRDFLEANPQTSAEAIEAFCRRLCEELGL